MSTHTRDTIKSNSKYFPRHTILDDTICTRDDVRQAISGDFSMIAASWYDGDVVNLVTNADASLITSVARMVGNSSTEFTAPICVGEYSQNKQGVDRLYKIRGRFSIADGYTYKR
ncbi:unnamed protein product [Phytophthora fragariaefolia]|uniref:Unnamed protein product n=1 Tax=Phytophthora fragariaefolia TaxID=1490495 RepID=A0A9W7D4Y1_9STRA|nr:unnamed protein product [Phytophthora fragariaefolia]